MLSEDLNGVASDELQRRLMALGDGDPCGKGGGGGDQKSRP